MLGRPNRGYNNRGSSPKPNKPQIKEEYAIILDLVQEGGSFKDNETIQAIGTTTFTLLELVKKKMAEVRVGDKVYIGDGKRDEIQFIKKSLKIDELSSDARSELDYVLKDIVNSREEIFIAFFNNAGPITIRKHALELIPGIGKKHLTDLLDTRLDKPFENFADLKERCQFLSDPQKAFAERIIFELEDPEDLKLFTRKN